MLDSKVRVKPSSWVARHWRIPRGARGTVLCCYRAERETAAATDRLDVHFSSRSTIWGVPIGV
jgi:hypothetical protein